MDADNQKEKAVVPFATPPLGGNASHKAAPQARAAHFSTSEIERARSVPLSDVLESLGAERDPKDRHNWLYNGSRITVTGEKFHDHNGAGAKNQLDGRHAGGGAIDLVQYLQDVSFRQAMRQLGGLETVREHVTRQPNSSVVLKPRESDGKVDARPLPQPDAERVGRARRYLIEVRAIPAAVVDRAFASGEMFSDVRGNVVFRLHDEHGNLGDNAAGKEIGYEVRGTNPDKPYHSVHGTKGMFTVKASNDKTAAFVESGIEALSYKALGFGGLVISTTGGAVKLPLAMAKGLDERGYELVMAFNADKAGDALAKTLTEALAKEGIHATRIRPDESIGKDWNRVLQGMRAQLQIGVADLAAKPPPDRGETGRAPAVPERDSVLTR